MARVQHVPFSKGRHQQEFVCGRPEPLMSFAGIKARGPFVNIYTRISLIHPIIPRMPQG